MKLLAKREIDQQKSLERQREIDEGMKLSRRLDSLRRTQVEEEASLERFRAASVSKIHEEIVRESSVRDALHAEVTRLEARKEEALRPLDRELARIDSGRRELLDLSGTLYSRQAIIEQRETALAKLERDVDDEMRRAAAATVAVQETLTDAEEQKNEAAAALVAAQGTLTKAQSLRETVEQELRERDAVCAGRERDLAIQAEWLETDRAALEKEKAQVADIRATLERAIKRLKK